MEKKLEYIDPTIITRKCTKTGTLVRVGALAIAYLAIIAMSL